jgi:hypothetical protein
MGLYSILGKRQGRKLGRHRRRWKSNIIVFNKELGYELYYNKSTVDFN